MACKDTPIYCTACSSGLNLTTSNTCMQWQISVSAYLSCASICRTCFQSANLCTSCYAGFSLFNNTCVNPCPYAMIGINSVCIGCASGCATCFGVSSNCTSCIGTKILYKQSCLDSIPSNLWFNSVTLKY